MKGNPEVITSLQGAVSALWSAATEYHLAARVLKHKDLHSLGHKLKGFGEGAEDAFNLLLKQVLFLGGKPTVTTDPVTDDYASVGDIFERLNTRETALAAQLNDGYAICLADKDADSGHDIKNVLHCVEGRIEWLERQLDAINECGGLTAYYAAKISG